MDRSIVLTRTCRLPLDTIVDQLATNAAAVIQRATDAAAVVSNDIVLTLDSQWAWFDVHEDVHVRVGELTQVGPTAELSLCWTAVGHKRLLPAVNGCLHLDAISSAYTAISYSGHHAPQPGLFNNIGERIIGRRVIDAAIGHLLDDIVAHLEQQTPTPAMVS